MDRPPDGNESAFIAWLSSYAPWIINSVAGASARFLMLVIKGKEPYRIMVAEPLLTAIIILSSSGILEQIGYGGATGSFISVCAGLLGPIFLRTELIKRFNNAIKAFGGKNE